MRPHLAVFDLGSRENGELGIDASNYLTRHSARKPAINC